jgi:hypothetical protein
MKEKDELKLSRILSRIQGESDAIFPWGKAKIKIKYINYSAGGKGCPDSLLILNITMPVLNQQVSVQVPILVEAEKAGIDAAMIDLKNFCERSLKGTLEDGGNSFIEIPMLVATEKPKHDEKTERKELSAIFKIREIRDC